MGMNALILKDDFVFWLLRYLRLMDGTPNVAFVIATYETDAESRPSDGTLRLRVAVFDALMAAKGVHTVARQAQLAGVARSTMFRLRAGHATRLDMAVRLATLACAPVEAIFGRDLQGQPTNPPPSGPSTPPPPSGPKGGQ